MSFGKSAGVWVVAAMLAGAGIGTAGEPGSLAAELLEISIEALAEVRNDPGLLLIELRDEAAVAAAMIAGAMRPAQIGQDEIHRPCIAVLVTDPATVSEAITAAAARFRAAGCALHLLAGDAEAWRATGLAAPARPRGQRRPGEVPFVVPRGICEGGEPAQVFE